MPVEETAIGLVPFAVALVMALRVSVRRLIPGAPRRRDRDRP
jgi:hypothetical protein